MVYISNNPKPNVRKKDSHVAYKHIIAIEAGKPEKPTKEQRKEKKRKRALKKKSGR